MKKRKKLHERLMAVSTLIILAVGLGITAYPSLSNYINSRTQSRIVADYAKAAEKIENSEKQALLFQARDYNEKLAEIFHPFTDFDDVSGYNDILDITGTGIMGYIDIPKIDVLLPIYHSTSPEVLNIAVGHLQGSSFPVGGKSTHAVISSHRGLPSSRLFTDIDKLAEDDIFTITVLDEAMTYTVDKITVIKPHEFEELSIIPDEDLVTLMTCTPYGINTHRLLVRGRRTDSDNKQETIRIPADAVEADKTKFAAAICIPVIILLFLFWIFGGKGKSCGRIDKYTTEKLL